MNHFIAVKHETISARAWSKLDHGGRTLRGSLGSLGVFQAENAKAAKCA
jgi:hypothetical protein